MDVTSVTAEVMYDDKSRNYIQLHDAGKDPGNKKRLTTTLLEAIPAGFNKCWETLGRYIPEPKITFYFQ
jgi:hypothetical protein